MPRFHDSFGGLRVTNEGNCLPKENIHVKLDELTSGFSGMQLPNALDVYASGESTRKSLHANVKREVKATKI